MAGPLHKRRLNFKLMDNSNGKLIKIIGISASVLVIGLWIGNWILLKECSYEDRGTFGDMFGSVNALFSGIALIGIIITILLQSNELSLQRNELILTRKEFNTQNQTLKFQRFENTFFNLLSIHHQIVDTMDIDIADTQTPTEFLNRSGQKRKSTTVTSRDVFKERYEILRNKLKNIDNSAELRKVYEDEYENVQTDFGHYFRNLYRIFKMVDETNFEENVDQSNNDFIKLDNGEILTKTHYKIKYKYTSIIRSQLSDYELLWLFYNCHSRLGYDRFKPLIEKYTILKNLQIKKLANSEHIRFYNKTAFRKVEI